MSSKETISPLVSTTTDPIEIHILVVLSKLLKQNIRYKEMLKKTKGWTELKEISSWKPFDFYNYFCVKYSEKYNKEYRIRGSLVRAYKRIEAFIQEMKISNSEYQDFIDLAFSRYFNKVVTPVLGHICSSSLYYRLVDGSVKKKPTRDDLFELDSSIAKESEKFQEELKEEGIVYDMGEGAS